MLEFAQSEGWIRTILTLTAYLVIGVGWGCVRVVEALEDLKARLR
jgi:hypothetical protein